MCIWHQRTLTCVRSYVPLTATRHLEPFVQDYMHQWLPPNISNLRGHTYLLMKLLVTFWRSSLSVCSTRPDSVWGLSCSSLNDCVNISVLSGAYSLRRLSYLSKYKYSVQRNSFVNLRNTGGGLCSAVTDCTIHIWIGQMNSQLCQAYFGYILLYRWHHLPVYCMPGVS